MGEYVGVPYQKHSDTSLDAATKAALTAATKRAEVLKLLWETPLGLTDEEIQDRLNMNPSTQRPRRVELVQRNMVIDSGRRRQTRARRYATVWIFNSDRTDSNDGR